MALPAESRASVCHSLIATYYSYNKAVKLKKSRYELIYLRKKAIGGVSKLARAFVDTGEVEAQLFPGTFGTFPREFSPIHRVIAFSIVDPYTLVVTINSTEQRIDFRP